MKLFFYKNIVFFLLVVVLLGCSDSKDNVLPTGVLKSDKMTEIFTDMQLVEAVLVKKRGKGIDIDAITEKYYDVLFEKYDITKDEFDSSVTYYQKNPDALMAIYEDVIIELNKKDRKIEQELKK
ncbi:MAG: DUF4296 domain-containing protein [Bacteroidota bacterium]|nr:DUF4296 domain-containing protein [Bacteroidota bacterium]